MPRQGFGATRQQDVQSGWSSQVARNLLHPLPGRPGQDLSVGVAGSLMANIMKKVHV